MRNELALKEKQQQVRDDVAGQLTSCQGLSNSLKLFSICINVVWSDVSFVDLTAQALSKALMDLRADMVTQAQDEVRAHADKNTHDVNVQKLIKMETKQLEVNGWCW